MPKEYLHALQKPGQTVNPVFNFLGVKVEVITKEKTVLSLPLKKDFIQGGGVTAGGIMATLADEAMAHVVLANLEEKETTATIEMNMRYFRPIKHGEIKAEAVVVKKGRHVVTVAVEVKDEKDRLLAQGGASFMAIKLEV